MCVRRRDPWHDVIKKYVVSKASLLAFYEGKAIRNRKQKIVYLVENGTTRAFNSAGAFLSRGFSWDNVLLVDHGISGILLSPGKDVN